MTKKTEATEPKSKYALVNLILRKPGLSDEGILDKFFDKQVKRLSRDIKTSEQNIKAITSNYEVDKDKLLEDIEDAEEALVDAYKAINPEDLKNNAAMAQFEQSYWANIAIAEAKVEALKADLTDLEDAYKAEVKEIESDIKGFKGSIGIIENFKK